MSTTEERLDRLQQDVTELRHAVTGVGEWEGVLGSMVRFGQRIQRMEETLADVEHAVLGVSGQNGLVRRVKNNEDRLSILERFKAAVPFSVLALLLSGLATLVAARPQPELPTIEVIVPTPIIQGGNDATGRTSRPAVEQPRGPRVRLAGGGVRSPGLRPGPGRGTTRGPSGPDLGPVGGGDTEQDPLEAVAGLRRAIRRVVSALDRHDQLKGHQVRARPHGRAGAPPGPPLIARPVQRA